MWKPGPSPQEGPFRPCAARQSDPPGQSQLQKRIRIGERAPLYGKAADDLATAGLEGCGCAALRLNIAGEPARGKSNWVPSFGT
jgi:hypothetical protein